MRALTFALDTALLLIVAVAIYGAIFFLPGLLRGGDDRQPLVPQRHSCVTEASTMIQVPCPSCKGEGGWHIVRHHWFKPDTDVFDRCEACEGVGKIDVEQLHFLPTQEQAVKLGYGPDGVRFCRIAK